MILIIGTVYSANYYADLNIQVDNQGYTTITGNSNYPNLTTTSTPEYTSKKGAYWTLNITKPKQFSEFIYTLQLPETASINYIKTTGTINIQNQGNKLTIKGYGENKPLEILIQYKINKETNNVIMTITAAIISIITAASVYYLYKKKKKTKKQARKKSTRKKKEKKRTKPKKLPPLPERQKQIMQLLIDKRKPLTQAQIRKELNLPKASTTRNINALELKGLIIKEKAGITNIIRIKK